MPKKQNGKNRKTKKTEPDTQLREGSKKAEIIGLLTRSSHQRWGE